MGIPTLIKTETASNSASLSFVDGASDVTLDSTYDEYMFVFTDINPATDTVQFSFQVNATDDAGGGYDTSTMCTTSFYSYHRESTDASELSYNYDTDTDKPASFQPLAVGVGNGSDESCAGIMHLFNPASTTYVKHWYSRFSVYHAGSAENAIYAAGYINDTTAVDDIQFKMDSGNMDGVIKMYGVG